MYLLLPLTKGHLSNVATISWQLKCGLIREGLLYMIYARTCMQVHKYLIFFYINTGYRYAQYLTM